MQRAVLRGAALAAALLCVSVGSQAALFEDDEARRAILDLRQRVEAMRQQTDQRLTDENGQLRRSLLDLQNQIEQMRGDLARMTGQNEQLTRTVSEMQSRQTTLDDKLKQSEPSKVSVDGREFNADPKEKADFDAALGVFRSGQFAQAQTAFAEFVKRYPQSGYNASALFWLGNAQYATRNYNEAIANFRSMLSLAPDHAKAPEAVLSIANCQIELKDTRAARRTLEDLTKAYPQSEAAQAGRERLSRLR
ncbi:MULTISPECIES: tol-pal system protein YbgF [Variovorax]|jgi:tol-pal system protein YbgF|uniref:tol-pal system protein YbgF n=1 Tax=Variovorax TaxID=34072 RepID=UPI00086C1427|nr:MULTISPECIES: tol-pal system protein YbgF [Variovorax]MBN8752096.1 tol-pal system protein YbgF [Variovorax sp.]ODU15514.1 MAG: tol-pal system protein YbgF [Variovorax sp. SCN 67-85]ODV17123.1 MAG: tol-pal system protein YbgF [Variovorax sp. SCN 67-20]OJZ09094.1 MAG: tol-pal system protein YbgF [Variovorax sp. 67-131]UKI11563.1 tol-pal system protein YbgF [Variovorax paradoxus]